MQDNIIFIQTLLIEDPKFIKVILEMYRKYKDQEYGYLMSHYENGKITCIKSEKSIK